MELQIKRGKSDSERTFLHQKMQEYNQIHFAEAGFENISVCMKDNQVVVAGAAGILRGEWLLIQELWVAEELRSKRVGSTILRVMEGEAKKRGCHQVLLDTFEFQAPGFYKKHGYREVFVYQEHPRTGKHYYLEKKL